MAMRRLAAWVLLGSLSATVLGGLVYTNLRWYQVDGMDWAAHDIPFWPGGAAMVLNIVLIVAPLFACAVLLLVHAIEWALTEVRR